MTKVSLSATLRRARLLRASVLERGPVEPAVVDGPLWRATAKDERVIPLLYEVVTGTPGLRDGEFALVEEMALNVAALSVRLEHRMLEVDDALVGAGIRFAVLKGTATAHLDYDDPVRRQFGDLDVLVHPADFARALDVLGAADWRIAYPLPRYHDRFTHAVTLRRAGEVAEIDLHQRIGHRALGLLVPVDELLVNRAWFGIAGRTIPALGELDRMIHACIHLVASRGSYRRLSSASDVLVLSRKLAPLAAEVLDRADRWRLRALVEAGIREAHADAMLPVPTSWSRAARRPIRKRDRLVEIAYLGSRRRPVVEELAHLRLMGAWRDRMLYGYGHLRMEAGPGAGGLPRRIRYLASRLRSR